MVDPAWRIGGLAWVVCVLSACATVHPPDVMEKWHASYRHRLYDYHVAFAPGVSSPLPAEWRLENLVRSKNRQLGSTKPGREYHHGVRLDPDLDGKFEEAASVFTYDLLFTHSKHNGRIWVSTIALPGPMRERNLEVLARDYLESVSTTGAVVIGLDKAIRSTEDKAYVTSVRRESPVRLDGREAREMVFDVVDAKEARLSNSARSQRAKVVLVRPPFAWTNRDVSGASSLKDARTNVPLYPVVLVLGYVNDSPEFARGLGDFDRMVDAVKIGRLVDLSPLRDQVFACEPTVDEMTVEIVVDAEGKPGAIAKHPTSSVAVTRCVQTALAGYDFPRTGSKRTYVQVFRRKRASESARVQKMTAKNRPSKKRTSKRSPKKRKKRPKAPPVKAKTTGGIETNPYSSNPYK